MTPSHAAALVVAGRLLQSRAWPGGRIKIETGLGESYPQAVARVIAAFDDDGREQLRELVAWVLEYERQEAAIMPKGDRRG